MPMKLRVMLVDQRDERVELLREPLLAAGHEIVARVRPADDLQSRVRECRPDVIIVDMDSPSRDTLEQMRCIHRDQPKPIVMFSESEDRQLIQDAVQAGVSAYIVDGLGHKRVIPILEVAIARFNEFQIGRPPSADAKGFGGSIDRDEYHIGLVNRLIDLR